ncbi:MAG: tetratricopeptide repeat-containing sulfotransferase family protein [Caulobacteraceae bacterium]
MINARAPSVEVSVALRPAIRLLAFDPARAEAVAREVLVSAPGDCDALIVLATALRLQGAFEAARAVLEPLAATRTNSWIVQFELAQVLFALGRTRAASGPLSRAVALNPALTAAWRLLGDILLFSGQFPAARAAYARQVASTIRDTGLKAAAEALAEGRLDVAERDLRSILARDPAAVTPKHLLGEVLVRRSLLVEAVNLLARCVEEAPDCGLARHSYASALYSSGRCAQAMVQLDLLLARDPADFRCRMTRAAVLTEVGDYAAAAEVTASLLDSFPDQPQGWLVHGAGLRTLGRIGEAIAAWRQCIALEPECSEAYWSLANLKTYRFTALERAAMEARLARPDLPSGDRVNLDFALGRAYEDEARWAEAFASYARGNAIEHGCRAYEAGVTRGLVQRSKALFTPEFFAERPGWGVSAPDPIFIVGLPRSGSTLVDQILASHSAVEGTRELHDIGMIADWVGCRPGDGSAPGYPQGLVSLPRDVCAKLGGDYLEWTRALRRSGRPRFVDKAPWNFAHVGLIRLILPNARIIDVRRHPLACCLSAFKQHFSQGWSFSYDLDDLGRYYADYVELMAHFDEVLPGVVHRVIYEELVDDSEAVVRRLLAHLDLPFDPACLRFFENSRAVATPSSEQVRRPIFADGVDNWRPFEPWLDPLKAALGPVLEAYPYAPRSFPSST